MKPNSAQWASPGGGGGNGPLPPLVLKVCYGSVFEVLGGLLGFVEVFAPPWYTPKLYRPLRTHVAGSEPPATNESIHAIP